MTAAAPPITPATRIARREGLLASALRGETVMLDMEQGTYFGLDDIGADIWARLAAPVTVGELCAQLAAVYDVDEAACLRDVTALVAQLREAGMLGLCEPGESGA